MNNGFIKNEKLLEEKVSDVDYLDITSSVTTLSEKLASTKTSIMIGVVGPFGVGKSTLVSRTRELRKEENEEWIHFDAWQFPDRKELWEVLVLETAKHLSKLEEVRRKVDGQSGKDKKLAVDTAGAAVGVAATVVTGGLSLLLQPLFGLIKNLEYFADKSPARRVFEIQDIFTSLINNIKQEKVVFILEDVDRSGEAGLFFLETFRQFLSNTSLTKKVVVIVAVSNGSYNKNIDSYLKCLDFVEFFSKKEDADLTSFANAIFETDVKYEPEVFVDFLNYFYNKYPEMNLRKIKLILRQANLNYTELKRAGFEPNRLICIAAVASKYVMQDVKTETTYFDYITKHRRIPSNNEVNRMILITNPQSRRYTNEHIIEVGSNPKKLGYTSDITLTKRANPKDVGNFPSTPYVVDRFHSDEEKSKTCLPDFYFSDL